MEQEKLNGLPLDTYGATLLKGGYAELMRPAEMKEWVSNESPYKDGTQYIAQDSPKVKERSVSLTFLIRGETEDMFMQGYMRFIETLMSGMCEFTIPVTDRVFKLKYESCTAFDFFDLKSCKIAVKFTEPEPQNFASNPL